MKALGRTKLLAMVALLALSVPLPAFAEMMDMPMGGQRAGYGQMMEMGSLEKMGDMTGMCLQNADKMGLTDDQVMKMKPGHREMQKNQARYKADLKIAQIELMEIMDVKDFDLEKANAAVKKITGIQSAHYLEMIKGMKEMRTMLTDEQFKKMKKMMPMRMGQKKTAKRMMKK